MAVSSTNSLISPSKLTKLWRLRRINRSIDLFRTWLYRCGIDNAPQILGQIGEVSLQKRGIPNR